MSGNSSGPRLVDCLNTPVTSKSWTLRVIGCKRRVYEALVKLKEDTSVKMLFIAVTSPVGGAERSRSHVVSAEYRFGACANGEPVVLHIGEYRGFDNIVDVVLTFDQKREPTRLLLCVFGEPASQVILRACRGAHHARRRIMRHNGLSRCVVYRDGYLIVSYFGHRNRGSVPSCLREEVEESATVGSDPRPPPSRSGPFADMSDAWRRVSMWAGGNTENTEV